MAKAYVIGIGGRTTSSLAKMLADAGWEVSGADQGVYPPASTYLEQNGIPFHTVYDSNHITSDIDLIMIGGNAMHVMKVNPEVERAKQLGLKIQSYPEVLHDHLEKPESILLTGTYGKTTVCALLAWIMETAGLNPSFDLGEIPLNFPDGTRNTNSQYSIIHGDEHPTLGYSELPKFAYFSPKYLIHTAAMWDHFNIYPTEGSFIKVFQDITAKLPQGGWFLYSRSGSNNQPVVQSAKCPIFTYAVNDSHADFFANDLQVTDTGLNFNFTDNRNSRTFPLTLSMLGQHNVENAVAAAAAATLLEISPEHIAQALKTFNGLKRHLELITTINDIQIYHDQGQHPGKFKAAVEALKLHFPHRHLTVILDAHASVLHDRESLNWYDHTLDAADQVIVGPIKIRKLQKGEAKQNRVTGKRILNAIKHTQKHVVYTPVDRQLVEYLTEHTKAPANLLFLSTGNFRGVIQEVAESLAKI